MNDPVFIFQLINHENGTRTKPFPPMTREEFRDLVMKMKSEENEIFEGIKQDYVLCVLNLSASQEAKESAEDGQTFVEKTVSTIPIFTVETFLTIVSENDHEQA